MARKITLNWENTKKLIDLGYNKIDISKYYNVSVSTVKRHLSENNFKFCSNDKNWRRILINNHDNAIKLYEKNNNLLDVSDYFGCDYSRIVDYFKSINYPYKTNNTGDVPKEAITKYISGYTAQELGVMYNMSAPKIINFLKNNNVKIRDKIELLKDRNASETFQRKCIDGSWCIKNYKLPSGKIIKLRGYEPNYLDYVFNNNIYKEDEIDYAPKRIKYYYNNKLHHYYPDFYIKKHNLIIEIKSSWILKKQGSIKNKAKEIGALSLGFNYKLILDNQFG